MADTLAAHHVLVRWASEWDDLRLLLGGDIGQHRLNPEAVLVAESARGLEGMVVLFDSGHSLIYVDHLKVREGAPIDTGPQLILAVNRYCQVNGKTAIFLVTGSLELAYLGQRRGAAVEGPLYRIRYDVTDREGATHA